MTSSASCEYSFVETVAAMHPFYVIRMLGGLLFLAGALIMVYNLWRTARGDVARRGAGRERRRGRGGGVRRRAMFSHDQIERNSTLLLVLILLVVSIGGIVEIAPLF